jgi:PKD repeat protein
MKRNLRFACLLTLLFLQSFLFANTVIVKGTVKDSANHPIANRMVKIYSTDSTNNGCALAHIVVTNPNGYYIDTLTCNGDIRKLLIIVENCNGTKITHDPSVTSSGIVESNFIICAPTTVPPTNCKAAFSYTSTSAGIKFNAAGSQAGAGDSIILRSWSFGDSTETSANVDPLHAYKKPGSYSVCLYIKTKNGCESRYCATVVFTPESNDCRLELKVTSEKTGIRKFHFFSNNSATLTGDSIVQRTWKFGDGSSLDGNQVSPIKEYKENGTYNVCLKARTVKGCEKEYCFTLTVRDSVPGTSPVTCKAYFTYSVKDSTVNFNSAASAASSNDDSIISRTWYFFDSSKGPNAIILTGNIVAPSYTYAKAGSYTVYLVIKTKKGCENKYTAYVVVPPVFRECKIEIHVNVEKSNAASRKVRFTSNNTVVAAGDTIIKRIWKFGDNTSLEGNEVYPIKEYKDTGVYNVCLKVKTARGCEKEYCFTVVIRDTVASASCKALFTYATNTTIAGTAVGIKFNSSVSTASAGDSIISRTWIFGDSTETITGNRVDPTHSFTKPGNYNVCLIIKTKNGCESRYCSVITVRPPQLTCKAYFTYSIKDSTIYFNSEASQASSPDDSIISRTWYYMDNANQVSLTGNVINPSYTYNIPGSYTVYLVIKTKNGCESKYAGTIVIPKPVPANCKALFVFEKQNAAVKFNSASSAGTSADDSITSRTWYFGDNTDKLAGNSITTSHTYAKPGTYIVYLYIKTHKGCESKYSATVVIDAPPTNCKAAFTYAIQNAAVKFNSSSSAATSAEDSIISRTWIFGDDSKLEGNAVEAQHTYTKAGTYNIYLYIKTKKGCESKYAASVVIAPVQCSATVQFSAERDGLKKVQFNSSNSSAAQGDSIIQRRWKFGDGTVLEGNVVSPLKEFPAQGIYTACLRVRTAQGCETEVCKPVVVQDSLRLPETSADNIKIITINPNPVVTRMMVTIWSRNNNVEVEISVYDIYGTGKMNLKKVLSQGNNIIEVSALSLPRGPYFLKVASKTSRDSKAFYKL